MASLFQWRQKFYLYSNINLSNRPINEPKMGSTWGAHELEQPHELMKDIPSPMEVVGSFVLLLIWFIDIKLLKRIIRDR